MSLLKRESVNAFDQRINWTESNGELRTKKGCIDKGVIDDPLGQILPVLQIVNII